MTVPQDHIADATPDEILAVVQAVCHLPGLTADQAVELDDLVFDLIDVVECLGPLLIEHGAQEIANLVRERCGDPQTAKEACEVVRLLGRMEGEYRGRYGRLGKPAQSEGELAC